MKPEGQAPNVNIAPLNQQIEVIALRHRGCPPKKPVDRAAGSLGTAALMISPISTHQDCCNSQFHAHSSAELDAHPVPSSLAHLTPSPHGHHPYAILPGPCLKLSRDHKP